MLGMSTTCEQGVNMGRITSDEWVQVGGAAVMPKVFTDY